MRAKTAKFAKATVKVQMASFKKKVFGQMVFKGFIYRDRKPVHWSPSSRNALAEAELEEGHISKSMYAIFRIASTPTKGGLLDEFVPKLSLAIWTTTPWTIPANAAVNFKLQYAIVSDFVAAHMSSKGIDLHTEECHHDLTQAEYKECQHEDNVHKLTKM
ncbi:isoleucine--tRNA ligase, chloroplastic/mitochondrial-like protein [Tanacetum coccineum]